MLLLIPLTMVAIGSLILIGVPVLTARSMSKADYTRSQRVGRMSLFLFLGIIEASFGVGWLITATEFHEIRYLIEAMLFLGVVALIGTLIFLYAALKTATQISSK